MKLTTGWAGAVAVLVLLSACASVPMRNSLPEERIDDAKPYGIESPIRLFAVAQRDGIDLNIVSIARSFDRVANEPFDCDYMRELFKLGREFGLKGNAWEPYLPGYKPLAKPGTS